MSELRDASTTRRLGRTPRLRALADCVPPGTRTFVDVGTNHGILPLAVLLDQRAERCIAIDKSRTALVETERRLRRLECGKRVELRLDDGLSTLAGDETIDVICLAGLGPRTILDVLDGGSAVLEGARERPLRLVLNPLASDRGPRAWLERHGYRLVRDFVVPERGREYVVLAAELP